MRVLERVEHQTRAANTIERAYSSGRLPHAYIFAGPPGVGKLSSTLGIAASWVCRDSEEGFCGVCRHCERVFAFNHPDVRVTIPVMSKTGPQDLQELFCRRASDGITPLVIAEKGFIGIAQIRELGKRLSRKAFEGRGHVEIILHAEKMRKEASNALLKTLEEPPDNTILLLCTSAYSKLLPTIRSRAQLIRFRRLPVSFIAEVLRNKLDFNEELSLRIASASDGSLGYALLCNDEDCEEKAKAIEILASANNMNEGELLRLSSETARKSGAEGILRICRELRAILHDISRRNKGQLPLYHISGEISGVSGTGEDLNRLGKIFLTCERRLKRNVMPAIALGTALLSVKRILTVKESIE